MDCYSQKISLGPTLCDVDTVRVIEGLCLHVKFAWSAEIANFTATHSQLSRVDSGGGDS